MSPPVQHILKTLFNTKKSKKREINTYQIEYEICLRKKRILKNDIIRKSETNDALPSLSELVRPATPVIPESRSTDSAASALSHFALL